MSVLWTWWTYETLCCAVISIIMTFYIHSRWNCCPTKIRIVRWVFRIQLTTAANFELTVAFFNTWLVCPVSQILLSVSIFGTLLWICWDGRIGSFEKGFSHGSFDWQFFVWGVGRCCAVGKVSDAIVRFFIDVGLFCCGCFGWLDYWSCVDVIYEKFALNCSILLVNLLSVVLLRGVSSRMLFWYWVVLVLVAWSYLVKVYFYRIFD